MTKRAHNSRRLARLSMEKLEERCVPALYPAFIELETLHTQPDLGFSLDGFTPDSATGSYVRGIGDVNNDGFDDVAVGSPGPSITSDGQVFVVFGHAGAFAANLSLDTLDGTNGFTINGPTSGDASRIAPAGDFNNDGIDDFIVGAPDTKTTPSFVPGKAYLIFGKETGFPTNLNLETFSSDDGVIIVGSDQGGKLGDSVAGVGDVNNDGIDDVILGAPNHAGGGASFRGQAFVIFGKASGLPATLNVTELDGTNGFAINGVDGFDKAGSSVARAGDVNGDGKNDVLVGAPASFDGHVYVVYGKDSFTASLELSTLDGTNGFTIDPFASDTQIGLAESIAGGGDVNGDGHDDILLGSKKSDGIGLNTGEAYVIYGRPSSNPFPATYSLNLLTGANGINEGAILNGSINGGFLGAAVALADINTDGIADILLGAPLAYHTNDDFTSGIVYALRGKQGPLGTQTIGLSNVYALFEAQGFGDFSNAGSSVASAGDVNGDGRIDVILGMPNPQNPTDPRPGQAFVLFGREAIPEATLTFAPAATQSGGVFYDFVVNYTDPEWIQASSIGTGDVIVTFPDGSQQVATLVGLDASVDGPTRSAAYRITPPGGFWDFRDNGEFIITLQENQVFNGSGKPVAGAVLGTFEAILPTKIIAVGRNAGAGGLVEVFTPDGTSTFTINAYPAPFAGGVRVAVGDVNSDGVPDVITVPGPGTITEIKIFNGLDGTPLDGFTPIRPYGNTAFGAFVAVGDLDGNPGVEIIVGPGRGPRPVLAYNFAGQVIARFFPYGPRYLGPVRVAAGNLRNDARAEIVTAPGAGLLPVRAFDQLGKMLWSRQAYGRPGGNYVVVADVNGDGLNEVVVGPEGANTPFIKTLRGINGAPLPGQLLAFPVRFFLGVRLGSLDVNEDGRMDVLVSTANGRVVRVFDWMTKKRLDLFTSFETVFNRGLFVAGA